MKPYTGVTVFLAALFLCALLTKPHSFSWNDASRLATAQALAQRGTFAIEGTAFAGITLDKYRYRGRTYSDKSPLLSIQAALVAALLGTVGLTLTPQHALAIYFVTLFTVGVWFALGVAYVYALQRLLDVGPRAAVIAAVLSGIGTLALPYATVLVNHVPAGAAVIGAVYHLARARRAGIVHIVAAALFCFAAYAFDPAAAVVIVAAAVLLWKQPRNHAAVFMLVLIPLIAAQLAFNVAVSGSPRPPVFNEKLWLEAGSPFRVRYVEQPFWQLTPAQIGRIAVMAIVGEKGVLPYMPLVIPCIAGLVLLWRDGGIRGTTARAAALTCVAYYVLLVLYHDYGSVNFGERRYADIAFLLCVELGTLLENERAPAMNAAVRALALLSVGIAALGTVAPFARSDHGRSLQFAAAEFVRLLHRAPVQGAFDLALVCAAFVLLMRYWPKSVSTQGVRTNRAALGDPSA